MGKLPKLARLEALPGTRVCDAGLHHILESAPLKYLDPIRYQYYRRGIGRPPRPRQDLYSLFLGGTQTTDAGLSYLQKLPTLQHLDLEGTQAVTDAGLRVSARAQAVRYQAGEISHQRREGLKYLANTRGLLFLDLSGTSVADDSLVAFAKLDHLLTLQLNGTRVTSKGMGQPCGAWHL